MGKGWADQMSLLLVTILGQVQTAKAHKQKVLPTEQLHAFEARYFVLRQSSISYVSA